MDAELLRFRDKVTVATRPEDLFGPCTGGITKRLDHLRTLYRRFVRIAHADKYLDPQEKAVAHECFVALEALYQRARDAVLAGTYGVARHTSRIATPNGIYALEDIAVAGDVSVVCRGVIETGDPVAVKVARGPQFNDFLKREADVLKKLGSGLPTQSGRVIPRLIDSAVVTLGGQARRVNVMDPFADDHLTLAALLKRVPGGRLDPRHGVWLARRLLSVLASVHSQHVVHGSVLPIHILVNPRTHGIMLVDWCFSVPDHASAVPAMVKAYRDWYPPEVGNKVLKASRGTDLYMAGRCLRAAMGEGAHVPARFTRILEGLTIQQLTYRPKDAWAVYDDVTKMAADAYGPPEYVELQLQPQGV